MIQKTDKINLDKIKPKAVFNTRVTRTNNVMRFDVELSSQSKKILASQRFVNLHRIKFPLHSIFFQNSSFFVGKTRSSAIAERPRDASCQLKSCQLPRNSAETTYTTSPDQIDGMKLQILSEAMRGRQCALKNTATASAPIVSSVINKPTTVELCISPVYRRLAVAKFSKSTM